MRVQSGKVHGTFELLRGWYHRHGGKSPRPTHKDLNLIWSQFRNLYRKVDPSCDPLPIHVSPAPVNDSILDEDEIWHAATHMQCGKSPGPSGIRVSDLLFWHEKLSDVWNELVSLIQDAFDDKAIPQEFLYEILCLIPKEDRGKYRGIALLEVVYKLVSIIIHLCLQTVIDFHPSLHGFRQQCGIGICILEAKLQMQLASDLCQPLYQVFLDLMKAYNTLDRDRTFGIPFPAWHGVHQGDNISPIVFNIVVDAVV
jgi:hypothetical protein